ncbi:MAG: hemerythrin-like metal-binding protein [Acidiferrobacteraceae bacterium]|jgi:hemerythrin-like metal-binding protein|nr:hemerythrin-like metal-binding protein [Acidiferrobacteraceae bacterium]MDP6434063.1 hemerythrin family protein [Arenicellales bacterium]MDP6672948.1 hemerythrin family protein [Arenicellales bacterium]MDP6724846.1 hemerythrin family protein [Arenicellales bacterium]|tara:strand:- start:2292 stop:2768 length:477 start_codon:yes stop_codon:yes gene_type:complete
MNLIEWNDEFEIGDEGVDHEHHELIKSINNIYRLIDQGADKEQIVNLLGDIYGSISAHFALEESVMRKHGYADLSQHKQDHGELLDQIREICTEVENEEWLDKARFNTMLNDWFLIHFNTHDANLHLGAGLDHDEVSSSKFNEVVENAKRVFHLILGK